MADAKELQDWFERWNRAPGGDAWDVLQRVARLNETTLRDVLRPHEEAGLGGGRSAPTVQLGELTLPLSAVRASLDDALDALTFLEIGFQVGGYAGVGLGEAVGSRFLLPEVEKNLAKLISSEAFIRYVDVYLFFGIRFLAARVPALQNSGPDVDHPVSEDGAGADHNAGGEHVEKVSAPSPQDRSGPCDMNRASLLLVKPPRVAIEPDAVMSVLKEMTASRTDEEEVALNFLDGFRQKRGSENEESEKGERRQERHREQEPAMLELWLRGLSPEMSGMGDQPSDDWSSECMSPFDGEAWRQTRFQQIADGIESWARKRAHLYGMLRDRSREPAWETEEEADRRKSDWICDTPVNGRLALADMYWLAGILRADVTPKGAVTYGHVSWLELLRHRAALTCDKRKEHDLKGIEDVLRSVFSAACELVQNAAELRDERDRCLAEGKNTADDRPVETVGWRAVFDEEMDVVARQRKLRAYEHPEAGAEREPNRRKEVWSKRLVTGEHERNLVGVSFSGGGIRSATFNLGVLQGLQELDLLRQVDYLSTVSGGGFIGAWLLGNVRRSKYWLGSLAPWEKSIAHLRAYSNYLAPRTGILSMDTWSLGTLWARNAFLIQLSGVAWLLTLFTCVYMARLAFLGAVNEAAGNMVGSWHTDEPSELISLLMAASVFSIVLTSFIPREVKGWSADKLKQLRRAAMVPVAGAALYVLICDLKYIITGLWDGYGSGSMLECIRSLITGEPGSLFPVLAPIAALGIPGLILFALSKALNRTTEEIYARTKWIGWFAVLPAWISAAGLAAHFFSAATLEGWKKLDYSQILSQGLSSWRATLVLTFVSVAVLDFASVYFAACQQPRKKVTVWNPKRFAGAFGTALACTLVVHLCLSAILYAILHVMPKLQGRPGGLQDAAFVATPSLVLLSYSLAILLFIGLSGKASNESQREWWTRFGGWILVFSLIGMVIPGIVFGGPWLIHQVAASKYHVIKWGAIASWLGTVVGGLFAGKSSKTAGDGASKSPPLQLLAQAAGLLFLLSSALGTAELLYLFFGVWLDPPAKGPSSVIASTGWQLLLCTNIVLLFCGWLFSKYFDINIFGLNQLYRNRLVRCYLGATRWRPGMRSPELFTKFDFKDDLQLSDLGPYSECPPQDEFRGPFPILNCTLNLGGSTDLALHTRHSASFSLTPLYCGADRPLVGYAPTLGDKDKDDKPTEGFANSVRLGEAVAVSGAAASPNMGYNTSPLVAFLLTMFNVRLGWWYPNPGRSGWKRGRITSSLPYMLAELAGEANEQRRYLNVSDGGHFENLGIYELVRRGCKVIITGDGEADEGMGFGGLANAIRLCATDFGAIIEMDVASIRRQADGNSLMHATTGTIKYSNGSIGRLIYLKASVTGDEDVSVAQYRSSHPTFPHQTTADQFFTEDQFESYRRLGQHVVRQSFRGVASGDRLFGSESVAEHLADVLSPASCSNESFLRHTQQLEEIWERLRAMPVIKVEGKAQLTFLQELMEPPPVLPAPVVPPIPLDDNAVAIGLEMLQFMENVYMDLRLDDFWDHPDNRGWAMLFMSWARSPRFRRIWKGNHRTFGIRFEYFCGRRLGLYREEPVMRVSPMTRD